MRPVVAVVNESAVLEDAEVTAMMRAAQRQVNHDFEPAWGAGCHLDLFAASEVPASAWQLVVLDDADQAGALGYHDLTPELLPLGKVFAKTTLGYGAKPSVTLSHELLEMLGDPHINLSALDPQTNRLYAYETADATEADQFGYDIDGVTVSDFVLPAWFDPQSRDKAGVRFDHQGHVTAPFELIAGGYISYLELGNLNAGWQQAYADAPATGARAPEGPPGSRRERRTRRHALKPSRPRHK